MLNSLDDKELGTCGLYRQRPIIKTVRSTGFLTLKERSDTVIKVKGTNVLALKRLALSDSPPSVPMFPYRDVRRAGWLLRNLG